MIIALLLSVSLKKGWGRGVEKGERGRRRKDSRGRERGRGGSGKAQRRRKGERWEGEGSAERSGVQGGRKRERGGNSPLGESMREGTTGGDMRLRREVRWATTERVAAPSVAYDGG